MVTGLLPYLDHQDSLVPRNGRPSKRDVAEESPGSPRNDDQDVPLSLREGVGVPGDGVTHYVAMSGIGHHAAEQPAGAAGNAASWDMTA